MNPKRNRPIALFQALSLFALGGMTSIYLFHLGEPNPVETITNLLTTTFALLATWMSIAVWTLLNKDDPSRKQWTVLSIGIGMWTMAELLWAFLSYTMSETPYPSVADAFWVPGYLMVLVAATLRYRALKIYMDSLKIQALLVVFLAIAIVVFVAILLPILTSGSSNGLLTTLLNIFYPIADLLVLFVALLLAYSLAGGRFSTPWIILTVGLATLSLSDILFIYAAWNGFYNPDGLLSWVTIIVDMGNLTAYVLIAYGVLLNYHLLAARTEPKEKSLVPQAQSTNAQKVMIFIDSSDRVVFANYNLSRMLSAGAPNAAGMPFGEVLGLSSQDTQAILTALHNPRLGSIEKYITQYRPNGAEVSGWLRARTNFNELREYTGADITCDMEWPSDFDTVQQSANRLITATHTLVFDSLEAKLALDYFSRTVHTLQQAIVQMGGAAVSSVFGDVFQRAVSKEDCALSLTENQIRIEKPPARVDSYARILSALTDYARETLSIEMVTDLLQRNDDETSPKILAAAQKFGLTQIR